MGIRIPDEMTVIRLDADKVTNWNSTITLKADVLNHLEKVAGVTPDERYLVAGDQIDLKNETWGWYLDDYTPEGRRVCFWFKNPAHAVYFKMAYGGQ